MLALFCFHLLGTSSSTADYIRFGPRMLLLLSSWLFAFCLLAGVFFTSDCIGAEKREGTIGLLFLTPLKGYDITAGKLVAHSLSCFYGLTAALPILAIPLLFGGVTIHQFIRISLALFDCLFLSLSIGILASSMYQEARKSMSLTALVLAILSFGFPLMDIIVATPAELVILQKFLTCTSPFMLFMASFSGAGLLPFWFSFWAVFSVGACCFALSGILTSRWKQFDTDHWTRSLAPFNLFTDALIDDFKPAKSLDLSAYEGNPFRWLAMRSVTANGFLWILLGTCGLSIFWMFTHRRWMFIGFFVIYLMHLLIKVFITTEACRKFHDDRKSGALELLYVTPVPIRALTSAYFYNVTRQFLRPLIFLICINSIALAGVYSFAANNSVSDEMLMVFNIILGGGGFIFYLDLHTLAWTGLAEGLKSRKLYRSVLTTMVKVMWVPWIGLIILYISNSYTVAIFCVIWYLVSFLVNIHWIRESRAELGEGFQELLFKEDAHKT